MLASPAYAANGAAASGGAAPFLVSIFPFILIFVIMYVLLFRPQQKRMKQHQAMIAALKKNDVAVTSGGIIGKVSKVDDNEVELEIASGVKVRVVKATLAEVRPTGTLPAND
jgi:preprotein translocase subunit YajC